MKKLGGLIIVFLLGLSIFSLFSYIRMIKERDSLKALVNELKLELEEIWQERQVLQEEIVREKEEKEKLTKEREDIEKVLRITEEKLAKINQELDLAQANVEFLKKENLFLRSKYRSIAKEKEELQSKLNSLEELKKAIRELRRRRKRQISEEEIVGNRGFLIKDGRSTYIPKHRIRVIPVPLDDDYSP